VFSNREPDKPAGHLFVDRLLEPPLSFSVSVPGVNADLILHVYGG